MEKTKRIERECKYHGMTEWVLEGKNTARYRCRKCRMEAVSRRRKKLKEKAVEFLGGKCEKCGYDKCIAALEFHHLYGKDFGLSARGLTRSWEKVEKELRKCQLLCANCHREVHAGQGYGSIEYTRVV